MTEFRGRRALLMATLGVMLMPPRRWSFRVPPGDQRVCT